MGIRKIATIVEKLLDATRGGKVEWEQTEKEGVFQTSYPDFSIRLYMQLTAESMVDSELDYVIGIYNSRGVLLESATDVDLKPVKMADTPFVLMKELYDYAKGYALGTEQALDSIINALSDDDIPF